MRFCHENALMPKIAKFVISKPLVIEHFNSAAITLAQNTLLNLQRSARSVIGCRLARQGASPSGVGGSTPVVDQAGRASLMAGAFKNANTESGEP